MAVCCNNQVLNCHGGGLRASIYRTTENMLSLFADMVQFNILLARKINMQHIIWLVMHVCSACICMHVFSHENKMVVCSMLQTFTHLPNATVSLCALNECNNCLLTGPHEPVAHQRRTDSLRPHPRKWRFHRHPLHRICMVFLWYQMKGHKSASGWRHIGGKGSGGEARI